MVADATRGKHAENEASLGPLRLIPLGGLGEVGMNCLVLEQSDGILVIDCGITFPEDDHGVDVLHPSFDYLASMKERVCGVFLTHGHEDHIGALPYLLDRVPVPVWGPAHALKLARRRLRERMPDAAFGKLDFRTAQPGREYAVGPFVVEPIRVAHSIIEATALAIQTCAGTVVHSGDFNFDPHPPDGQPSDERRLTEIGDRGVALLLSDSTNIDSRGEASSERDVATVLEELVSDARQRVVVGMFSSNVQRLISLGRIARDSGRLIALLGRSLRTHVETAVDLGHLAWNAEHRLPSEEIAGCPPERLLLLAGGTQAESGSALDRLSRGTHPALALDAGDSVILSSRIIPGNDRKVSHMMSELLRRDVHLYAAHTRRDVHTSGHANRVELEHMLDLLRPQAFVPVHGTRHHLHNHALLARERGVSECLVIENGEVAVLDAGRLHRSGCVPARAIAVDRVGNVLDAEVLRDRALLGQNGLVRVHLAIDAEGTLASPVRLEGRGVAGFSSLDAQLRREIESVVRQRSKTWQLRGLDPSSELQRFVSFRLGRVLGQRPLVDALIDRG